VQHRRHGTRFALVALAAVVVAAMTARPATAAPAGSTTTRIEFTATLDSQQRVLEQVGRGGVKTYGWNELTGTASTDSGDVQIQLLGNVDYVNGSGQFFGFVTMKFASLSTLGLRIVDGRARVRGDGSTALRSRLRVIGGNAAMTGAKGTGTMTGERREELGTAIELTFDLRVRGISS
jgi:hypothetical protein